MREKYLKEGFVNYIAKPIDKEDLVNVLNSVLVNNDLEKTEVLEIFDTVTEAEKKYNLSSGCIKCAIRKNWKSAGYHWEYV